MRLQKYLSTQGHCSRSEAETLIKFGRVEINGKKAVLGDKVSPEDKIVIDGKILEAKEKTAKKVLAFYKPVGLECSMNHVEGAKSLLDIDFGEERVFPIGHIDGASSGLILMTNDGNLANELSGLKQKTEYVVALEELDLDHDALNSKFSAKFGEDSYIKPQGLELLVSCNESRTRDIRQFFIGAGFKVLDVVRIKIGNIRLLDLEQGQYRQLNLEDIASLI
ncbi:MAG: S4 domain-containing protein [Desulfotalea sp.]